MSRFVSGGTDAEPTQRDEAWLKAQKELDAAAIAWHFVFPLLRSVDAAMRCEQRLC
jgi:hypothetical protein